MYFCLPTFWYLLISQFLFFFFMIDKRKTKTKTILKQSYLLKHWSVCLRMIISTVIPHLLHASLPHAISLPCWSKITPDYIVYFFFSPHLLHSLLFESTKVAARSAVAEKRCQSNTLISSLCVWFLRSGAAHHLSLRLFSVVARMQIGEGFPAKVNIGSLWIKSAGGSATLVLTWENGLNNNVKWRVKCVF